MKARFRVQHGVLSGLKYVTAVKRKGIRVGKDQEMLVSFTPLAPISWGLKYLMCVLGIVCTKHEGESIL